MRFETTRRTLVIGDKRLIKRFAFLPVMYDKKKANNLVIRSFVWLESYYQLESFTNSFDGFDSFWEAVDVFPADRCTRIPKDYVESPHTSTKVKNSICEAEKALK